MEGKAVLFKKFADIDSIDLEVDSSDIDKFVNCIEILEPSFGGINLEDIKAPDCFIIEQKLRERMKIPVFHDDQHGTAIITAAGLINAFHLTNRDINKVKIVCNGAGAASIACVELLKALGVGNDNITLVDRTGVIYKGRTEGLNQWKSAHAVHTSSRTLEEALVDADAFIGLSSGGVLNCQKIKQMKPNPIIFDKALEQLEADRSTTLMFGDSLTSDYQGSINSKIDFCWINRQRKPLPDGFSTPKFIMQNITEFDVADVVV